MTVGFYTPGRRLFTNLSDEKTVILSVEKTTIVWGVLICNKSDITVPSIRMNLYTVALLEDPIQQSYQMYNSLIETNQSMNLLSLLSKNQEVTPLKLLNGDSLICHSNGFSQKFDCSIYFDTLNELNDEFLE